MIKILEIRKVLTTLIKDALINANDVYYQKPAEKANFPYLLMDISSSFDDGTLERFILDLEGVGQGPSTVDLETMMDSADKAIHRKTIYIENAGKQLSVTFYRESRLTYDETDKRLHRRRYTYQIRTYEK
jgi:hypothetical protein